MTTPARLLLAALALLTLTACDRFSSPPPPPAKKAEVPKAEPAEPAPKPTEAAAKKTVDPSVKGKRTPEDDDECDDGRKAYDFDGPNDAEDAGCHTLRVHYSFKDPDSGEFKDAEKMVYCCR